MTDVEISMRSSRRLRKAHATWMHLLEAELDREDNFNLDMVRSLRNDLETARDKLVTADDHMVEEMMNARVREADIDQAEEESINIMASSGYLLQKAESILHKHMPKQQEPDQRSENGSVKSGSSCCHSQALNTDKYKHQKIEIPPFNGDLKQWLGWWALFKSIHEAEHYDETDKFAFLIKYTVVGSKARAIVESYPPTKENYPKVIEDLQARFGRKKLLQQMYIRELLKMVLKNAEKGHKPSLTEMYLTLSAHLRNLASLGVSTEQSATFLFPLVESSLPEELLVVWQRSPDYGREEEGTNELDRLMAFLKKEVDAEEQRSLARSGFGCQTNDRQPPRQKDETPHTAAALSTTSKQCIFCGRNHLSHNCRQAERMSLDEKKESVKKSRACFSCLEIGHAIRNCHKEVKCTNCNGQHYSMMCHQLHESSHKKEAYKTSTSAPATSSNRSLSRRTQLMTLVVNVGTPSTPIKKRLMLDCGSEKSYVTEELAKKVKANFCGEEYFRNALFGGATTNFERHARYGVHMHSLDGKFSRRITLVSQKKICGNVPNIPSGPWIDELNKMGITVTDLEEATDVDILIGSDLWASFMTGKSVHLENGLMAMQTVFGWVLSGEVATSGCSLITNLTVTSLWTSQQREADLWSLETIGISDPIDHLTKQEKDEAVKAHFAESVTRAEDGRYCVQLPWIDNRKIDVSNRAIAERRLMNATQKLLKIGMFQQYTDVFNSWIEEGIIEEITNVDDGTGHYLPHRAVIKPENKTTPIRPVFDASCRGKGRLSLNDCLEKGPNLLELLPSLLLRFRKEKIGVISDIRRAFLQISLTQEDKNFVKFLWWEKYPNKFRIFRHARVVFGVNCSPFLLGAVIDHHLRKVKGSMEPTAMRLIRSTYVDNCVTSVGSAEEYHRYKQESVSLFGKAKMELRQWESSLMEEGEVEGDETSVLGLKWNKVRDTLRCAVPSQIAEVLTKRSILSIVQRVFDPLGMLSPALLPPKILIQKAWASNLGWDEPLDDELRQEVDSWIKEMTVLQSVEVPRLLWKFGPNSEVELHGFCDASKVGYAAAIFLRVEMDGEVDVQLIQSKTRVAPLKSASIPRLELMSCCIVSRLVKSVVASLDLKDVPIKYWSDSTTAIAWIKRSHEWGRFVGNRVEEIRSLTDVNSWSHVPGELNPADLPSRGCSPSYLLESKWWEGPAWLRRPRNEWPKSSPPSKEEEVIMEMKKTAVILAAVREESIWYSRRSSHSTNVRILGWILRIRSKDKSETSLTLDEIKQAERRMFLLCQKDCFSLKKVGDSFRVIGLESLPVIVEDDGLIRVKTKLLYRHDTENFRLPVLLPNTHPVTSRFIEEVHKNNCHAGIQFLMSKLRETVWIVGSRRCIRRVVGQCVTCRRFCGKSFQVPSPPLPENRVKDAKAFEIVGIDLAGPLFLKNGTKVWIVLFTCAVFRCVHLELVDSLSTPAFILALMRFINRRGRMSTLITDNGKNFVGTENLFEKIDWDEVQKWSQCHKIEWRFNLPTASWSGGFFERLIRSVKELLRRILGHKKLSYVQLETCLTEVEAVVNGRPLTYVSEAPDDLVPLTPAMFLMDQTKVEFPEIVSLQGDAAREKYRDLVQMKKEIRERFRSEYLSMLVDRRKHKQSTEVKIGDIVLIGSDDKKRTDWPIGRVVDVKAGRDGHTRTAWVKTEDGQLLRPAQRLYPLELDQEDPVVTCVTSTWDRCQVGV